jgi:hypothetical protein
MMLYTFLLYRCQADDLAGRGGFPGAAHTPAPSRILQVGYDEHIDVTEILVVEVLVGVPAVHPKAHDLASVPANSVATSTTLM